jgi:hypothetical protein
VDLVVILIVSMLRTGYGRGVDWKGRLVRVERRPAGESAADIQQPVPEGPGDVEC